MDEGNRAGRLNYFLKWLTTCIVGVILAALAGRDDGAIGIGLIIIAFQIFLAVPRLRDIGNSPWLSLLLLVPVVNIGFLFYLFFAPGMPFESDPQETIWKETKPPLRWKFGIILGSIVFVVIFVSLYVWAPKDEWSLNKLLLLSAFIGLIVFLGGTFSATRLNESPRKAS